MKSLKRNSRPQELSEKTILTVESQFNIKIPKDFISFLKEYGGTSTQEVVYNDDYWVNFFLPLLTENGISIVKILIAYQTENNTNAWLPFAIDSGGWPYLIALKDNIYGQVWVDKFDSGDEKTFAFVAPSFEEFISTLKTEDEAFGNS